MIQYTYTVDEGYITSLADLRRRLSAISVGNHQWAARILPKEIHKKDDPRPYIMIGYTNPALGSLPNNLCFLFPIVEEPEDQTDESRVLVCLHSGLAIVLSHGLYFEGDKVKRDILGDWLAFWSPLGQSLINDPPEV